MAEGEGDDGTWTFVDSGEGDGDLGRPSAPIGFHSWRDRCPPVDLFSNLGGRHDDTPKATPKSDRESVLREKAPDGA